MIYRRARPEKYAAWIFQFDLARALAVRKASGIS